MVVLACLALHIILLTAMIWLHGFAMRKNVAVYGFSVYALFLVVVCYVAFSNV